MQIQCPVCSYLLKRFLPSRFSQTDAGTAQNPENDGALSSPPPCFFSSPAGLNASGDRDVRVLLFPGILFALLLARVCLPFVETGQASVYRGIAAALVSHQNWGKQALAGALEYPPLPSLILLVLTPLCGWLRQLLPHADKISDPVRWLVAGSQLWTFVYLLRLMRLWLGRFRYWRIPVAIAAMALIGNGFSLTPSWAAAVPLAVAVYHLACWEKKARLRDEVVVAICAGLLVLCGLQGMLAGAVLIGFLCLKSDHKQPELKEGRFMLLAMPFLYLLLLYPLFNWLVMGHPWFFLQRFFTFFAPNAPPLSMADQAAGMLVGTGMILALILGERLPDRLRLGLLLAGTSALGYYLEQRSGLHTGGGVEMGGWSLVLLTGSMISKKRTGRILWVPMLLIMLVAGGWIQHRLVPTIDFRTAWSPPGIEQILQLTNRRWKKSRILIFDLRSAVLFSARNPKRFPASLDFNENWVRQQISAEQFHLLLAPDNGHFYPRTSRLAELHENGAPWLFLEQRWASGWQLWRCVRPLRPESIPGLSAKPTAQKESKRTP